MPMRRVTVSVADGLHARPVAELARLALEHSAPVHLRTADGVSVNVASVLAVMELGLSEGDEIDLETISSPHAEHVLETMARVLDPKLNPHGQ